MMTHALTWLTLLPLLGSVVILLSKKDNSGFHRTAATVFSGLAFALSLLMWPSFDGAKVAMQFVDDVAWIPSFGIHYHLGVDGLSFPLVLLTTLLTLVSVIASFGVTQRTREYFFWFLLLETGMLGLFVSLDFFLFYVFWELTLVPMYF